MNLKKFKSLYGNDLCMLDSFNSFRIWAENSYVAFQKSYDIQYAELRNSYSTDENFFASDSYEDLVENWDEIPLNIVINLYSEMGWLLDKKYSSKKVQHSSKYDAFGYQTFFSEVFPVIQSIKDNIEFFYSLISLIDGIQKNYALYSYFVLELYCGIRKFDLTEAKLSLETKKTKKVFVAMNFNEKYNSLRPQIRNSITENGYEPVFIDNLEHNNQIVPEILKEIQDCHFVIADLSGQRGSVYFEAGYALAKNKPLILTCSHLDVDNIHFDLAQIKTIFWEDEYDLYERLKKRIDATIGHAF